MYRTLTKVSKYPQASIKVVVSKNLAQHILIPYFKMHGWEVLRNAPQKSWHMQTDSLELVSSSLLRKDLTPRHLDPLVRYHFTTDTEIFEMMRTVAQIPEAAKLLMNPLDVRMASSDLVVFGREEQGVDRFPLKANWSKTKIRDEIVKDLGSGTDF